MFVVVSLLLFSLERGTVHADEHEFDRFQTAKRGCGDEGLWLAGVSSQGRSEAC